MRQKIFLVASLLVLACGGSEKPNDGSAGVGGSTGGVGGTAGAAGSSAGAAGASNGGSSGAGTGGGAGQAGSAAVGGAGGSAGAAGSGTGGAGAGAGTGGLGGGGAGGLGGSGASGGASTGCGKEWNPANAEIETRQGRVPVRVVTESQMIAGIEREWIVAAPTPENYDPNKPYPVVFGWHGQGGTRTQLRGYLNLEQPAAVEAIFIYPSGLPLDPSGDPTDTGWPPGKEEDLALVDALLERYAAEVCIDRGRVFATGHSYGGIMSQNVGCARGNIFRGIAPVAGGLWGQPECQGQVAALMIHSPKDTATSYSGEIGMCTEWLRKNTCDENPACGCNWVYELDDPADECVQMAQEPYMTDVEIATSDSDDQPPELRNYLNCDADYPVAFADHWRREGRDPERWHNPPPWAGALIWEFFSRLGSVPPRAPSHLEQEQRNDAPAQTTFLGWLPEDSRALGSRPSPKPGLMVE